MIEPTQDNVHSLLTALEDGELDPSDAERVWSYYSAHPELAPWLEDQRKLIAAAHRTFAGPPPKAPDMLRLRVEHLSQRSIPMESNLVLQPPRLRSSIVRQAVAAVLLLAMGGIAGHFILRPNPTPVMPTNPVPVIPASIVARVGLLHADCSRLEDVQHADPFPEGELSTDVRRDLASEKPYPDLSRIGFRYLGAGPCGHPLEGTIHLLYRSTHPNSRAAVSVFVQRFTGQFPMENDRIYSLAVPQSPFPTLTWRTGKVVYFLVADDAAVERQAVDQIRAVPLNLQ